MHIRMWRKAKVASAHRSIWRKRQIILEPQVVEHLFEWHGGQNSALYALASSGMRDLVSLSMIHAALGELEREKGATELVGELDTILRFWPEHSTQEYGMDLDESEYEYDEENYGTTPEEERLMLSLTERRI